MTNLKQIILNEIAESGPMNIERYMELCLSHPEFGYYQSKQPFGSKGDFITSPEISQMFGEMIGVWLLHFWHLLGCPTPFTLVELGPGRGTLMTDILRVTSRDTEFMEASQIVLLETSKNLRKQQKAALSDYDITFIESVHELPERPILVVANEFFDALPIRQFVKNDFGWQERQVDKNFEFCLSKTFENAEFDKKYATLETGKIVEESTASHDMLNVITNLIASHSGGTLIIDYGEFEGTGDTLQAVKSHQFSPPLSDPGKADLTAHVRFSDLVQNGVHNSFSTQRDFLLNMGIEARQQALERATEKSLQSEFDRLTGEEEMGMLFKVLALSSIPNQPLPGF